MVDTYTKEQLDAAVATATDELRQEIAQLREGEAQAAIDAAVAEQLQPIQDELASVKADLDVKTAELNSVVAERDTLKAAEEARETAEQEAAERSDRVEARKAAVAAIAEDAKAPLFSEEEVAERAERWADMDDAAFEALCDELRLVAAKTPATVGAPAPRRSPLTAADAGGKPAGGGSVAAEALRRFRADGVDVHKL